VNAATVAHRMGVPLNLTAVVDVDRYPIDDLASPTTQAAICAARESLAQRGVAALPGFLRPEALRAIADDVTTRKPAAHLENVWGTPYLGLPDESFPEGHPQRTSVHSLTWVLAYDLIRADNPARQLFEWDGLTRFLGEVLERRPLYRMNDPLGALNLTLMEDAHVQGWHYDSTDFVVSLAVQSSDGGGEFECARDIRDEHDEHYDDVARVLAGSSDGGNGSRLVEVYPMMPGTLMVFMGRRSLHRVAPVVGTTPRIVALFGYDTRPDTNSSELLKLVRYGRTESVAAAP
jgi:hypothetical protein